MARPDIVWLTSLKIKLHEIYHLKLSYASKLEVIEDLTTFDLLVYNLQLPHGRHNHHGRHILGGHGDHGGHCDQDGNGDHGGQTIILGLQIFFRS